MDNFANRLKEARLAKGMTEQELADKLHVTRQAVSKWENGINYPDVSLFTKIAEILEVDISYLFYDKESRSKLSDVEMFSVQTALKELEMMRKTYLLDLKLLPFCWAVFLALICGGYFIFRVEVYVFSVILWILLIIITILRFVHDYRRAKEIEDTMSVLEQMIPKEPEPVGGDYDGGVIEGYDGPYESEDE